MVGGDGDSDGGETVTVVVTDPHIPGASLVNAWVGVGLGVLHLHLQALHPILNLRVTAS